MTQRQPRQRKPESVFKQHNGLKASKAGVRSRTLPSPSIVQNVLSTELFESFALCYLFTVAQRCFFEHFRPLHGASWQNPRWTWYVQLAIMFIGKRVPYLDPRHSFSRMETVGRPFYSLLFVAFQQSILYNFLEESSPRLVFWLGTTIYMFLRGWSTHGTDVAAHRAMAKMSGTRGGHANLAAASTAGMAMFFAVGWLEERSTSWMLAQVPYQLLPSGFMLPFMVTITASLASIWSSVTSKGLRKFGYILVALIPIFHGLAANTHAPWPYTTRMLNNVLSGEGYEVLARGDGRATGYASVLQNNRDGFRALRCEHSLLGGFWLNGPGLVKDPIYGVFVMLEAVRLIVPTAASNQVVEERAQAASSGSLLNIGLGIGTAPAAFIHHGMNVTIVEIDQIIYDFAVEYFELPEPHTAVIGDAVELVHIGQQNIHASEASKTPSHFTRRDQQYDFIVHDVFTGGVEPAILFTAEFLTGLHDLLHPDGAIAINYAGDFTLPSAQMVLRTILAVFPSCRIFRETEASPDHSAGDGDQTNVVVFCRKQTGAWDFREPTTADHLRSPSREQWLMPRFEIDVAEFMPECATTGSCFEKGGVREEGLLWEDKVKELERWQVEAGRRHWELMREVIPPLVWDNW